MAVQRLREIAAKLQWGEALDSDEAMLAGRLIHMIARGVDPRPIYLKPLKGRPTNPYGFEIALHYRLTNNVGEVADAWGYDDVKKIHGFERQHRTECDVLIQLLTPKTREHRLKELRLLAVSKKR